MGASEFTRDWLFLGSEEGEGAVALPETVLGPGEPPAHAREWHALFTSRASQRGVMTALRLRGGDDAAWHALGRVGCAFADVHPFDGVAGEAPRWRWRLYQDGAPAEDGVDAILLPIDGSGRLVRVFEDGALHAIADLIACPVNGRRMRSYSGLTPAFGMFNTVHGSFADGIECLTLLANGMRWLMLHVAQARALGDGLSQAAMRGVLEEDLALPDERVALVLAPELIDWKRVAARRIACPDSAGLARTIDAALHVKEKARAMPDVLGPRRAA